MRPKRLFLFSILPILAAAAAFSAAAATEMPRPQPVAADEADSAVRIISSASVTGHGPGEVTIGVMDTVSTSVDGESLRESLVLLSKILEKQFRITWEDVVSSDAAVTVKKHRPDFLVVPTSFIEYLEEGGVSTFRIATRKPSHAVNAGESVGSLFVTLADRDDIRTVDDLRGRHVAADQEQNLPGYLAAQGEIAARGYDPDHFFGRVSFLNTAYPNVVSSLLAGKVDAAILPACLLEVLERSELVAPWRFKVIGERKDGKLACLHSTALYPDISVVSFDWTPEPLVRKMTVSLLSEPATDGYEWLSAVRTAHLKTLYKTLGIGPYAHLKAMTPAAIYSRWKTEIHFALLILFFIIVNEMRLRLLVKRRTQELSEALTELRALEAEAREARNRIGSLERKSIVTQMSGMIAHEIRSPVGAIRNFAATVRILLKEALAAQPNARSALEGIDREALRIAGIVDRVRGYVKNQKVTHVECDLVTAVNRGLRAFSLSSASGSIPVTSSLPGAAHIRGDSLELELLVLNLIKNAAEAVSPGGKMRPNARVDVSVFSETQANLPKWVLTVQDNGPVLTAAEARRLTESFESVKPEGLGLGLSIVRGIADSHGAAIRFAPRPEGGVIVRVAFDVYVPSKNDGPAEDNVASADEKNIESEDRNEGEIP